MDPRLSALVCVLAVVGVGVYAFILWRVKSRRDDALISFAAAQGWGYRAGGDAWCAQLRGEPFGQGSRESLPRIISGHHRGLPFQVFQYNYHHATLMPVGTHPAQTGSDFWAYSVASVLLPFVLPLIQVKPEGVRTRLKAAIGMHDLQLGHPEFDGMFHVSAADLRIAQLTLSPAFQQWMLSDPRFIQCPFRISGNEILTWWPGELNPELVLPMLEFCGDVVAHLPSAAQQARVPLADLRWSVPE